MRKIKLKRDMRVPGWGTIAKDTAFKVCRFNSRFVYVNVAPKVELRLARKADCEIVY